MLDGENKVDLPVAIKRTTVGSAIGEILVRAIGLPDGVTCESRVSKSDGESSKQVKLEFFATRTEPYSGEIQILGEPMDSTFRPRKALTPERFRTRFESIWITATGE